MSIFQQHLFCGLVTHLICLALTYLLKEAMSGGKSCQTEGLWARELVKALTWGKTGLGCLLTATIVKIHCTSKKNCYC